jgi:plastocyanin
MMESRVLQRVVVSAVAASVVALAAACDTLGINLGGDPEPLSCSAATDAEAVVGAGNFMESWLFSPDPVSITVGQAVCWVNVDGNSHTVTPSGGSSGFGGSLTAQDPFVVDTFTVAGDYNYVCDVHPEMGGLVHVTP